MSNKSIREVDGGVVFTAKTVPGSSQTSVCGLLNGMVKIKVSAPAEKGKANQCLIEFLAVQLGIKKRAISIISGPTNPVKQIQVLGISCQALLERLNLNE
ncbi:MAG: DUF167 domain-containing protein [Planctomycetota bacterium]